MYTKQNILFSHSSVFSSNISSILCVCMTSEREEEKKRNPFFYSFRSCFIQCQCIVATLALCEHENNAWITAPSS